MKYGTKDALVYVNYIDTIPPTTKSIAKGSDKTYLQTSRNNHLSSNAAGVYSIYHKPHAIWQNRPN